MTEETTLTPAEKLKQALAAKKAKVGHGFSGQPSAKAEEKKRVRTQCRHGQACVPQGLEAGLGLP